MTSENTKSASKHSPGPWTLGPADDIDGAQYYRSVSAKTWQNFANVVVRMEDDDHDSAKGLANAALIAAAPDLLEALEAVVAVADRKTDVFNRAHAAIAKAKGLQP